MIKYGQCKPYLNDTDDMTCANGKEKVAKTVTK